MDAAVPGYEILSFGYKRNLNLEGVERNDNSESVGVCVGSASGRGEAVAAAKGKTVHGPQEIKRCGFGNAAMRCLC